MDLQKEVADLKREVQLLKERRIYTADIAPGVVTQQKIKLGRIIFAGLAADLPSNGSTEVRAYYAEDTKTLYLWNTTSETWDSEIFT